MKITRRNILSLTALTGLGLAVLPSSAVAQQVLKVGTNAAALPLAGVNPQTKLVEGLAPEVLAAVAKDAGLQIEFEPMVINEFLPALLDKKIDIIASTLSPTPDREKAADFTQAYFSFRDVLIVPATDTKVYETVADFKGMTIAVGKGTSFVDALQKAGANVFLFVDALGLPSQGIPPVEDGRAAGFIINGPVAIHILSGNAHPTLKIVDSYTPILAGDMAFGVQKGNTDLLNKLNTSLTKLKADGTIKAIATKLGLN